MFAAAFVAAIWAGPGFAQSTPADPMAPGAGADAAKEDAKSAKPAETPKPKPKAKARRAEAGSFAVTVHNDRSVGMVELRVGPAGAPELKKMVGPLAFGRKTVIHLRRTENCLYDVHAQFADEADTDQSGVDLCKDKAINLTD